MIQKNNRTTGNGYPATSTTGKDNRKISDKKNYDTKKQQNNRQRLPGNVNNRQQLKQQQLKQQQPATEQPATATGREFFIFLGKSFFFQSKIWEIPKLFLVLEFLKNGSSSRFLYVNKKNGQRH